MNILCINLKYDSIIEKMDEFLKGDSEGNKYDQIYVSGFVPKKKYYDRHAVVVLEPTKYVSDLEFVSFSNLKKQGILNIETIYSNYIDLSCHSFDIGRYTFKEDEIIYVKGQCSDDRSDFYKEYWNGILVDEKNYGDCSCFFKMTELIVYPEGF